jgi:hypothetical protein
MPHKEKEPMSNAERQAKHRAKMKADGRIKLIIWARPDAVVRIKKYANKLEK